MKLIIFSIYLENFKSKLWKFGNTGKAGLWTHGLDIWTLDSWTLGLWTAGRLDSGRLNPGNSFHFSDIYFFILIV